MKYFILSNDKVPALQISRLIEQLEYRDFRTEIKTLRSSISIRKVKKALLAFAPDIFIVMGLGRLNEKLLSIAGNLGIRSCYYELDNSKKDGCKRADLRLLTLPEELRTSSENAYYIGNPQLDLIKDYDFEDISLEEQEVNVAVNYAQEQVSRIAGIIIRQVVEESPKFKFHISTDQSKQLSDRMANLPNVQCYDNKSYDLFKQCNVAITTGGLDSLEAAFLNCPQVVIQGREIKFFERKKSSLINRINEKNFVGEFRNSSEALEEINLIVSDQQYCATMLAEYQIIKEKIGYKRASREAAQIIVEYLEKSGSS